MYTYGRARTRGVVQEGAGTRETRQGPATFLSLSLSHTHTHSRIHFFFLLSVCLCFVSLSSYVYIHYQTRRSRRSCRHSRDATGPRARPRIARTSPPPVVARWCWPIRAGLHRKLSRFQVSGFRFPDLGFGIRVSGFGFRVS